MTDNSKKNLKLIISYDGTDYSGWQIQKEAPTISQTLQDKFYEIFGKQVKIVGASRTDAGVHALGQVACLQLEHDFVNRISIDKLKQVWNSGLPKDILIRSMEEVPNDFHPQKNVEQKTYYYHFSQKRLLPFLSRYFFHYRFPLDIEKLKQSSKVFIGTHDFRSFCTGDERENTIRTIDSIELEYFKRFEVYRLVFKGKSFLHHMIRRITGALLEVSSDEYKNCDTLLKALEDKNPEQNLLNAPAHGLLLRKIIYRK
ncbi:tRNA pseudouridine(38-40) synthase TruA [Candidatus Dependentiae bacterium]|nr:tRNA pseudouridine(38-40) synthase TruA [Candidatus Dependentiae bacterium]